MRARKTDHCSLLLLVMCQHIFFYGGTEYRLSSKICGTTRGWRCYAHLDAALIDRDGWMDKW